MGDDTDGADLFSDCGDEDIPDLGEIDVNWEPVKSFNDTQHEALETTANVSNMQHAPAAKTDLIDSGCTRHISPYREDFTSFREIPPKSFRAANKQQFSAVGTGELTIHLPEGTGNGKLELTEVLYSPEVGYTLVSVG